MPVDLRGRRLRRGAGTSALIGAVLQPAGPGAQQDVLAGGSGVLDRLGRAAAGPAGRLVVAVWLLLAAGAVMSLPGLTQRLAPPSLEVPGSPSAAAAALIARGFPELGGEQMMLAFSSAALDADEPRYEQAIAATVGALAARPDVGAMLPLPETGGRHPRHAYVLVGVHGDELARQRNLPAQLASARQAAREASAGAVTVTILGVSRAFAQLAHADLADLRSMEAMTVPVAAVLLVLGLGAVGAAAVPLVVGGAAILTGVGALAAASTLASVDSTMLTYTVTMSLGLGLDYTLLILLRYRQARRAGLPPPVAAGRATATAGGTVTWCGAAIVVTSCALLVVGVPWAHSLALAGMLAALVTLAAALTLGPALLSRLDRRLEWGALPWRRPRRGSALSAWLRRSCGGTGRPGWVRGGRAHDEAARPVCRGGRCRAGPGRRSGAAPADGAALRPSGARRDRHRGRAGGAGAGRGGRGDHRGVAAPGPGRPRGHVRLPAGVAGRSEGVHGHRDGQRQGSDRDADRRPVRA
ncbi:MMPL family transporter [Nonomuraea sp. NPDC050202]|uniref:MMPL family transporter n=1 Tax=Nonomuraea sp. NPDC050202 TaxID=3155035 RepID=UPI0033EBCA8D